METEDREAPTKWNNPIWRRVEVSTWAQQGGGETIGREGGKERREEYYRVLRSQSEVKDGNGYEEGGKVMSIYREE